LGLLLGSRVRLATPNRVAGIALGAQAIVEAEVTDDPRLNGRRRGFDHGRDRDGRLSELIRRPVQELFGGDGRGRRTERDLNRAPLQHRPRGDVRERSRPSFSLTWCRSWWS